MVLIERGRLGGDTLNKASLPSKALVAAARRAHLMRTAAPFGIANDQPRINARGVFDHVHEIIDGIAPITSPEHLTALGVELIAAEAKFVDPRMVEAGGKFVRAHSFVIATGSRPLLPDIKGLGEVPYFTSTSIFDNPRKLSHLVIIGGGPVGIELAQGLSPPRLRRHRGRAAGPARAQRSGTGGGGAAPGPRGGRSDPQRRGG